MKYVLLQLVMGTGAMCIFAAGHAAAQNYDKVKFLLLIAGILLIGTRDYFMRFTPPPW